MIRWVVWVWVFLSRLLLWFCVVVLCCVLLGVVVVIFVVCLVSGGLRWVVGVFEV